MSDKTVKELMQRTYEINLKNGWWPTDVIRATEAGDTNLWLARLALVHSEVSEAVEDVRVGAFDEFEGPGTLENPAKPCGLPSELADICIRVFDMAYGAGIDLSGAIERKLDYNETRAHRHGDKKA